MKVRCIFVESIIVALAVCSLTAQTPVLSSIEAPYPAIQSSVRIAGGAYAPGSASYGPAGTPLVLRGSNFGPNGTVLFPGQQRGTTVQATVTIWNPVSLFLTVPAGATSGLVMVAAGTKTSNGVPFIVTPGTYASSCPALQPKSHLEIGTSSLPNGTVGQAYNATLIALGGSGSYTWSLIGNALPAGLSLSAQSGTITGTPTGASGPISISVNVVDNNSGQIADAVLGISIESQALIVAPGMYSYAAIYDPVGNVQRYTDSVNGTWSFNYDSLNRLATATGIQSDNSYPNYCWSYDSFGNRTMQMSSSSAFPTGAGGASACQATGTVGLTFWAQYSGTVNGIDNNQMSATSQYAGQGNSYDAAGNVLSDNRNQYLYDAEGRICAVASTPVAGTTIMTGYIYNAEGARVAKGSIQIWGSCDPTANGFQLSQSYLLGRSGEQLTMLDGSGNWQRTNVYGGGGMLATYDIKGMHFQLTDPLGTRRLQTNAQGEPELDCQSMPFGDQQNCFRDPNAPASAGDATPLHFTGKERDSESGNDYFGARYYGSSMGRFMSPDPSQLYYADPTNPQSFNLYSYGQNNPLINIDPTGMDCIHVNVDTGKYEGFERGDCDNSTEEKANSGQYVDGTVNSITTSTGDANGVVRGYGGTNDDTGALISGTFASPLDAPLQQIPQIDLDEQRIDSLVQGVATDTASMPWLCNTSVSLQAQIPNTPLSVGVTADRNGISPSAKASKTGPNGGVAVTTNGKKVGVQVIAPVTPFVNATLSTGQNQATVGVSKRYKFGPGNVSAGASLTFGYLGDSHCR